MTIARDSRSSPGRRLPIAGGPGLNRREFVKLAAAGALLASLGTKELRFLSPVFEAHQGCPAHRRCAAVSVGRGIAFVHQGPLLLGYIFDLFPGQEESIAEFRWALQWGERCGIINT